MSSVNKIKEFFGLGPYEGELEDDYYAADPYGYEAEREPAHTVSAAPAAPAAPAHSASPRYVDARDSHEDRYARAPRDYSAAGRTSSYRADSRRFDSTIVPVRVSSYNDALEIGRPFRDGDSVVFDVSAVDEDQARRIVDFAAGLAYALHGEFQRVAPRKFALVPEEAYVTDNDLKAAAGL